jgi:O-antigen ligase
MRGIKTQTLIKEAYKIPVAICLFFIPLFFVPAFGFPFTQGKELFFKTVVILALVGAALVFAKKGGFPVRKIFDSPVAVLLAITATVAIVADAFSPTPLVAIFGTYSRGFGLIINLYLLVFAFYCAVALKEKDIRPLLRLAFISGVITAGYALLQKAGMDWFFRGYDTDIFVGRVFGFLGNPGYLGQFMLLILLTGIFLFISSNGRQAKIFYLAVLLSVIAAMFFSGTRTAFMSLAVCAILVAVKYARKIMDGIRKIPWKKIAGWKTAVLVLVILTLLAGIYAVTPKDRFSLSGTAVRSVESRLEIWKGAFGLFLKRPVLGYGEESFFIYFPETITKKFLTLEEDINLSADRIHNEFLERIFAGGILGGVTYLLLFIYLLRTIFKSKNRLEIILALIPVANIIQNQFGFSDISISVFNYFCLGALVALQAGDKATLSYRFGRFGRIAVAFVAVALFAYAGHNTVYCPVISQLAYAKSIASRPVDYSTTVNELKKAIDYTPYYSQLWYELIFIDPSSMPRALSALELLEGESGSVLAWKGNMYAASEPQKAADYYFRALEKNPYNPAWIRTFGDMLYKSGDYEDALFLYRQYLDAAPDFWKWSGSLESMTPEEQKSYRIFFKNSPDFLNTVARVDALEKYLSGSGAPPAT